MFDLGWSELLIIGVAALIVVGPKDLPRMLRSLGRYAARAKGVAREFQRAMDDAARQADIEELKDVKKGLDDMRADTYKMQRDMSQSFLDGSSRKAEAKGGEAKGGEAKGAEAKGAGVESAGAKSAGAKSAGAKPAPAAGAEAKPAPADKAGAGKAKAGTEPEVEPGGAGGA